MSIATTVGDALAFEEIDFRTLRHRSAHSPAQAAERAGIPSQQVAKAALLKDPHGCVLAAMPARDQLDIKCLRTPSHRQLTAATDHDLDDLSCDRALGSVPPIGPWCRVSTVVDITLGARPDVYFEAGDHRSLVQVGETNFERLMQGAEYFAFSNPADD